MSSCPPASDHTCTSTRDTPEGEDTPETVTSKAPASASSATETEAEGASMEKDVVPREDHRAARRGVGVRRVGPGRRVRGHGHGSGRPGAAGELGGVPHEVVLPAGLRPHREGDRRRAEESTPPEALSSTALWSADTSAERERGTSSWSSSSRSATRPSDNPYDI